MKKLSLIIANLLSGRAHNAPEPVISDIEKALIVSIKTEPHMWSVTKTSTPDKGEFLLASNREKGVHIGAPFDYDRTAWSGKLDFSERFTSEWFAIVEDMHTARIEAEKKRESETVEKQLKTIFKL